MRPRIGSAFVSLTNVKSPFLWLASWLDHFSTCHGKLIGSARRPLIRFEDLALVMRAVFLHLSTTHRRLCASLSWSGICSRALCPVRWPRPPGTDTVGQRRWKASFPCSWLLFRALSSKRKMRNFLSVSIKLNQTDCGFKLLRKFANFGQFYTKSPTQWNSSNECLS